MKTLWLHYPGEEAASRWYRGRLYGRKLGTVESELAGVAEWVVDWLQSCGSEWNENVYVSLTKVFDMFVARGITVRVP